jgi:hypothetical protein
VSIIRLAVVEDMGELALVSSLNNPVTVVILFVATYFPPPLPPEDASIRLPSMSIVSDAPLKFNVKEEEPEPLSVKVLPLATLLPVLSMVMVRVPLEAMSTTEAELEMVSELMVNPMLDIPIVAFCEITTSCAEVGTTPKDQLPVFPHRLSAFPVQVLVCPDILVAVQSITRRCIPRYKKKRMNGFGINRW